MAKLKVIKDNVTVQEFALEPQQTYLAGRGDNCQIRLDPEAGISRQHFQLSMVGGNWKLEVLSRFGELYVGGVKSPGTMLVKSTTFSVPPYQFEYSNSNASDEKTNTKSGLSDRTQLDVLPSAAFLRLVDGSGKVRQSFRLEGDGWIGGRDVTCSLYIENPKISRKQFELYREGAVYYIRDLASANGTLVNGNAISHNEWTQLDSGDVISIVDWTLHFELKDATYQDRIDAVDPQLKAASIIEREVTSTTTGETATNYGPVPEEQELPPPPPPRSGQNWGGGFQQDPGATRANFQNYSAPMPPPPGGGDYTNVASGEYSPSLMSKIKKQLNPIRILIFLLVLGAGIYALMDDSKTDENKTATAAKPKKPFDTLSPEDQQFVMQAYKAANTRMERREFTEALQEIAKIKQKIPVYEESDTLEKTANEGIARQEELKHEEQLEKEKAEMEEKIQAQVAECRKQLDPQTSTVDSIETCLASVMPLNPEHPAILNLKAEAERFETDRKIKDAKKKEFGASALKMKALFDKAMNLEKKEEYLEAIRAYEFVERAKYADPHGYRALATKQKAAIIAKMADSQKELEQQADQFSKDGKFREAVVALRQALKINPDNEVVKGHLTQSLLDLRKQMQGIYQESILDESVGDVETAKTKWKKVIDQSLSGEDYFEKARLKLKKYGAM